MHTVAEYAVQLLRRLTGCGPIPCKTGCTRLVHACHSCLGRSSVHNALRRLLPAADAVELLQEVTNGQQVVAAFGEGPRACDPPGY